LTALDWAEGCVARPKWTWNLNVKGNIVRQAWVACKVGRHWERKEDPSQARKPTCRERAGPS